MVRISITRRAEASNPGSFPFRPRSLIRPMTIPLELEHSILESLSTPLLLVGDQGVVRWGNDAAVTFWRLSAARMAGRELLPLFGGDERVKRAVGRAIAAEASTTIEEVRIGGRRASTAVLRVRVDPVLLPGKAVDSALIVLWDETHRIRLEADSLEERVMESIGSMAQRLAHELQNPLGGMKGATQLLERRLKGQSGHGEYIGIILKEMERMERLVSNLLSHGGEPPLNRSLFNLHQLLDEVLWFVANSGADVRLEREYDPSLPDLRADRDRMQQVFLNLIRNAVEASPKGGAIHIRTGMTGPWREGGNLPDPAATYFEIEVEDEGAGVAPEHRSRLFTPLFTTKETGRGLGLSISYPIVRAHQGHLRYRPAARKGAVFSVILPMRNP